MANQTKFERMVKDLPKELVSLFNPRKHKTVEDLELLVSDYIEGSKPLTDAGTKPNRRVVRLWLNRWGGVEDQPS